MKLVTDISLSELSRMAQRMFEPLVKAVIDVKKGMIAIDADMHSDEELYLLEQGSMQEDLWGINFWPEKYGTDEFVEFDSMINIRPRQNNRTRGVQDAAIRAQILDIVEKAVYIRPDV